jgi:hypothetical protein
MRFIFFLAFGLILQITNAQANCASENFNAFNFWIGEWTVTNADGTMAGESTIDKIQDNCILRENWSSASGNYTGTSTNFYNIKTKQWEQLWIDNQGQSLKLKGNRVGNQMILESEAEKDAKGKLIVHKITWTANTDGTIRQKWEMITNKKDTVVAFNGLYKKKEN